MQKKFFKHKTADVSNEAKIGEGTKIWSNVTIHNHAVIGKNCVIGHNCYIDSGSRIGNNVKIESNTDIWNLVELEDYVFVGPSAVFTNDLNPRSKYPKKKYPQYGKWFRTLVEKGASIGANATIICGNKIGKWAFVGAGSVVTKNIPDFALVVGVPAKIVGWICECGTKLLFKPQTAEREKTNCREHAECGVCGRKYTKKKEKVERQC